MDWYIVSTVSSEGRLLDLLARIPLERWGDRSDFRFHETLLHCACRGPNVAALAALIQSRMIDVNACDDMLWTAAHIATTRDQPRALEVLRAAGANLRLCNHEGFSPIDYALWRASEDDCELVCVLLTNGVRLSTVHDRFRHYITTEMKTFELGILKCRKAVIAMLRLKKAAQLWHVDRFLLREIGFTIWATRGDKGWEEPEKGICILQ